MAINAWNAVVIVLCITQACAGQGCQNGDRKEVTGDCNAYLQCEYQVWASKQCNSSILSFDRNTKTCRYAWLVSCQNAIAACTTPGGLMQVPGECQTYYRCLENGQMIEESCSFFRRFDTSTNTCQWFYNVNCSDHAECSGSIKIPVKGKCQNYYTCDGGKYVLNQCGTWEAFDPVKNTCVSDIFGGACKGSQDPFPVCLEGSKTPVPGQCDKFYKCVKGRQRINECYWFQRFDPDKLKCDYAWKVECTYGNECQMGAMSPSVDCSKYFLCENGYWNEKSCGDGEFFDSSTKTCVKDGATCFQGECSLEGLKKQVKGDCSKYKVCQNGRYYEKSCGTLEKFDTEKRECRFVWDANCEEHGDKCVDGNKIPVEGTCHDYMLCVNGIYKERMCIFPYAFDRLSLTCRFLATCTTDECYNGQVKPVSSHCKDYLYCQDGQYQKYTCLFGTNFDSVTKKCVSPSVAVCYSSNQKESRHYMSEKNTGYFGL